jgi:hypothetical protein
LEDLDSGLFVIGIDAFIVVEDEDVLGVLISIEEHLVELFDGLSGRKVKGRFVGKLCVGDAKLDNFLRCGVGDAGAEEDEFERFVLGEVIALALGDVNGGHHLQILVQENQSVVAEDNGLVEIRGVVHGGCHFRYAFN